MPKQIEISKAELEDAYNYFKKSINEIANDYNTNPYLIKKLLEYYNIKIRNDDNIDNHNMPIIYTKKEIDIPNNFSEIKMKLSQYNIEYNNRHHNTILFHSSNETWKHFISKCILSKILRDRGHEIFTEIQNNDAITDILDLSESICYELESNPISNTFQNKKEKLNNCGLEIIIFDLRDVPDSINEIIDFFNKKV